MFGVKRPLHHPQRAKIAAYVAATCGVTVEHLLAVIKARKEFRRARMYRKRSRERVVAENQDAKKKTVCDPHRFLFAGEGALHALLRMMNLSTAEFCRVAEISQAVFNKWYGHPMYGWPVRFLEVLYYAREMETYLRAQGVDTEQFKPVLPAEYNRHGRYPKKKGDVDVSSAPLAESYSPWK